MNHDSPFSKDYIDALFNEAFPQARRSAVIDERPSKEISDVVESNLKDCTLIGPDAGRELRAMVYGPKLWDGDQA